MDYIIRVLARNFKSRRVNRATEAIVMASRPDANSLERESAQWDLVSRCGTERPWLLMLVGDENDGTGCSLCGADLAMDRALAALYDSDRKGGLGSSAPNVARWLGDIREYFPSSVVRVMQQDALERL